MKAKIFGVDYDLGDAKDIEKISDLIERSQVNSAQQIAHVLLTHILLNNAAVAAEQE